MSTDRDTASMSLPSQQKDRLLRHRGFQLFWIGESASKLGTAVTTVAMPMVAVNALHAGSFAVSALSAAVWLPWLVLGLPAGAWVDRLPHRPLMIICDLVSAGLLLSVPVAYALHLLTIQYLLIAAAGIGAVSVFFSTACQVLIPAVVAREDIPEANAKFQGAESTAQLAGPSLGGLLTQWLGAVSGLLLNGLTFLVSAVCLARLRPEETQRSTAGPRPRHNLTKEIGAGLRFLFTNPYLRPLTIYTAVANLAAGGFEAIVILFLLRDVGAAPGAVGVMIGITSAGGLVGALVTTRLARRFGTARGTLLSEFVAMPFALIIPLTTHGYGLTFFLVGGLVINAGTVVSSILTMGFRQTYCPPELLGRVTSASRFLAFGTLPIGAFLAGAIASSWTIHAAVWISCITLSLSGLILLASPLRSHRDFPTETAPAT
ncbi:MFS transporter [Kitasatospora sp. MMS16-BH015]|uniref:MFS transporter n=1 Tax=Kitasatospora sp. MMS16-BH015 TaxID=2018025 RepID=UPI000CA2B339|nr:MFS transporter [Kitasatospora sp. MMS16-BH015]AUG76149.1 MFS transporter [Kitasatospora sp. MMS16-BH015]